MNETDLRVFLVLADTENTRDAAALLVVNQSNVSRSLARLEREVGAELFARHGRRLELNRAGAAFREEAVAIVAAYESGRRRVRRLAGPDAPVRLGFLQSVARRVVPKLIGSFRDANGPVRFELRQGFARELFGWIGTDDLDVAFATPPRAGSGLSWHLMDSQRLAVALPAGHRLAGRESVSWADLGGEDFIAFARSTELRQVIEPMLSAAGAEVRVAFESSEIDTIKGLVAAGLGVSVLPVSGQTDPGDPEFVPLRPAATRELGISWTTLRPLPSHVEDFVEHCRGLGLGPAPGAVSAAAARSGAPALSA